MKKVIIVIFVVFINCNLKAQLLPKTPHNPLLETIANKLISFDDYRTSCDLTLSIVHDRNIRVVSTLITKKVPKDTLCGFYYHFQTDNDFKQNNSDFSSFFGNAHYISINSSIKKTSYFDKPERFSRMDIANGYVPAIQRSSSYYYVTPYVLGKLIHEKLEDYNTEITQEPDTLIDKETCLKFIIITKEKQVTTNIELCFQKDKLYPVYYLKDSRHLMGKQFVQAKFSNSKINEGLPNNFFTENNLFEKGWESDNSEFPTNSSLQAQEIAPEWKLPILGADEYLSSKSLRGKYILLEFTATWCGHCWEAVESMNKFEDIFRNNSNIAIVSIFSSEIDKREHIEKFAKQHKAKSTILYAAKEVGDRYQVSGYPNFLIISPTGKILKNYKGCSKSIETKIIENLKILTK